MSIQRLCIIDVPGLSESLLSAVGSTSAMGSWIARNRVARLTPTWPAVTCSVQATLTTGMPPSRHGIVANGIFTHRSRQDQALVDSSSFASFRRNVSFWEQSNQFVEVPRFWQDALGNSRVPTAMLFFQHSMPGFAGTPRPAADIVVTPKPEHGPDGQMTSLLWTQPRDLQSKLFSELGPFPLLNYWGPMAGIASSRWIAQSGAWVWQNLSPQLQLIYVPHLDYDLQRFGPRSVQAQQAVVDLADACAVLFDTIGPDGQIILLSEYVMEPVSWCIRPNEVLREAGLLATEQTEDGVLIDHAHSRAFAMVDHQIAHVYVREADDLAHTKDVLTRAGADVVDSQMRIAHRRGGDLQLESPADSWFDYRWWDVNQPQERPSFATIVDIHRKCGYDGLELFFDPAVRGISQDASRLRGSHGRVRRGEAVLIGGETVLDRDEYETTDVAGLVARRLGL
jgi:predicted AlkP superfamily pyrophosphatase or phosphodiesterase